MKSSDRQRWVEDTMQHFSLTEWADFVRETNASEKRVSMQRHLDSQCAECLKTADIWRTVMDFARHEKAYDPPASAMRIVQAYFGPLQLATSAPEGLEIAQLTFDSFQQAGLAGVRGASSSVPRQLLYKCGTLCIDMRLEPKPGSNYVVLVGQLIDAKKPLKGFEDVPVSLLSEGDKVSETTTNQFGEFHFAFESVKHLQLFFGIEQKALVVPLPEAQTEAA
jgi:hypothetical protein